MKAVVVGGHTRNIGKTSVMGGLIRGLEGLEWTAVKVTQYGHGICSLDGKPCGCAPTEHAFVLREEDNPRGRADTCRFLAAGARRSLWLRARDGQLADAIPLLKQALSAEDYVVIESNSILEFLKPAAYLVVLDSTRGDFKASARRFVERADALVVLQPNLRAPDWTGSLGGALDNKPVFPVSPLTYFTSELGEFVRERLGLSPRGSPLHLPHRAGAEREHPWLL